MIASTVSGREPPRRRRGPLSCVRRSPHGGRSNRRAPRKCRRASVVLRSDFVRRPAASRSCQITMSWTLMRRPRMRGLPPAVPGVSSMCSSSVLLDMIAILARRSGASTVKAVHAGSTVPQSKPGAFRTAPLTGITHRPDAIGERLALDEFRDEPTGAVGFLEAHRSVRCAGECGSSTCGTRAIDRPCRPRRGQTVFRMGRNERQRSATSHFIAWLPGQCAAVRRRS